MEVAVAKKLTYAEFREMDFSDNDGAYYELLNGEIVARNSPTWQHQAIVANLIYLIKSFIMPNNLGKVFGSPLDVILDDQNAPQPDVLFIRRDRLFILDNRDNVVHGAPDLVIEVISPTSIRRDRSQKMKIYEQFGVREYWLVDPKNQSVEVYQMQANRYEMTSVAAETGQIESSVLEGIDLDVNRVFYF